MHDGKSTLLRNHSNFYRLKQTRCVPIQTFIIRNLQYKLSLGCLCLTLSSRSENWPSWPDGQTRDLHFRRSNWEVRNKHIRWPGVCITRKRFISKMLFSLPFHYKVQLINFESLHFVHKSLLEFLRNHLVTLSKASYKTHNTNYRVKTHLS